MNTMHEAPTFNDSRQTTHASVPWGPLASVAYAVLVYFAAQFIAGLVLYIFALLRGWNEAQINDWLGNSVIAQFWYVLLAEVLTFGAIWWILRLYKARIGALGWNRLRLQHVGMALAGFALYFVGYAMLLTLVTHLVPGINTDQKQELGFDNVAGTTALVLTFVSLVILPPLIEETVFRGFVYTGLRNTLKPVTAALATSLLFAVAHLQLGSGKPPLWIASFDTFSLSLVLCYLRQKSDSLWPGVLLHALKNGVAFVSLFILHLQ